VARPFWRRAQRVGRRNATSYEVLRGDTRLDICLTCVRPLCYLRKTTPHRRNTKSYRGKTPRDRAGHLSYGLHFGKGQPNPFRTIRLRQSRVGLAGTADGGSEGRHHASARMSRERPLPVREKANCGMSGGRGEIRAMRPNLSARARERIPPLFCSGRCDDADQRRRSRATQRYPGGWRWPPKRWV
jgi:hypothetical protein